MEGAVVAHALELLHTAPEGQHLTRRVSAGSHGTIAPGGDGLRVREYVDPQEANLPEHVLPVVDVVPGQRLEIGHGLGQVY